MKEELPKILSQNLLGKTIYLERDHTGFCNKRSNLWIGTQKLNLTNEDAKYASHAIFNILKKRTGGGIEIYQAQILLGWFQV